MVNRKKVCKFSDLETFKNELPNNDKDKWIFRGGELKTSLQKSFERFGLKDYEEKRKADLAPDKDKLLAFAIRLEQVEIPKVDSEEADEILTSAISAIAHTAKTIRNLVKERL